MISGIIHTPPITHIDKKVKITFIFLSQKLVQNTGRIKLMHLVSATKLNETQSINVKNNIIGYAIWQVVAPQSHLSGKYIEAYIGPRMRQQQRSTKAKCSTNTVVVL